MYFCEKRELNCLKRLILQRIIYIILMDSNNLTPLRKGVVGVQFLFVAFGATVLVPLLVGLTLLQLCLQQVLVRLSFMRLRVERFLSFWGVVSHLLRLSLKRQNFMGCPAPYPAWLE